MDKGLRSLAIRLLVLGIAACSSTNPSGKGFRALEAVVVERIYEPPGSPGTSFAGSGAWYLVFEAKDGEATAHYRFPVTQLQYNRYTEGSHVELVLADDRLREIRPLR